MKSPQEQLLNRLLESCDAFSVHKQPDSRKLAEIVPAESRSIAPIIRLALPADAPAIAQVLAEAFAVFQPLYTPGAFAATTPSAEVIAERFGDGPLWVAEAQGAVVGTASAVVRGDGMYVRSVAVLPAARGQRLGQALTPHLRWVQVWRRWKLTRWRRVARACS